jgi:hypothetical protein
MASNLPSFIPFPSAARTAEPTPVVFENVNYRFSAAVLYVSAAPTALSTITFKLENYDPASNTWQSAYIGGATPYSLDSTAGGSGSVISIPHSGRYSTSMPGTSANNFYVAGGTINNTTALLFPTFRVRVIHSNTESWTYSLGITFSN